jgi:putative ABC transport system permease protein
MIRRIGYIALEAFKSAMSQRIASLMTVLMVSGMCLAVLLTTGRSIGAEAVVLGTIDDVGTRAITVRASPDAGLDSSVLDRLSTVQGIAWLGALGPATDSRNSRIEDGALVAVRTLWASDVSVLGIQPQPPGVDRPVWVSDRAQEALGMLAPAGAVTSGDGLSSPVVGHADVPIYLEPLEPLAVAPTSGETAGTVSVLIVVAKNSRYVDVLAKTVSGVLGVQDATKVQVTTSDNLSQLRATIQGQLGSFGRELTLVVFAVTGVLTAGMLYAFTTAKRKDFGRRRALGASRSMVFTLVLTQTGLLALVGVILGCTTALGILAVGATPLPGVAFVAAVAVLAIAVSLTAAALPALGAARRDPIRELRVP